MRTVSGSEMQTLDRRAISEYGIPSLLLMENAGRGVAEIILKTFKGKTVWIFCGKGNNGGDGIVAARHLSNHGYQVRILLFADPKNLKNDVAVNYQIAAKMKLPVSIVRDEKDFAALGFETEPVDIIVDALFGVGLHSPVEGIFAVAIDAINRRAKPVVAVDMPSGIHSDTGEILGTAVKANVTATLGLPKHGLVKSDGPKYAGTVCVLDIGMPVELLTE